MARKLQKDNKIIAKSRIAYCFEVITNNIIGMNFENYNDNTEMAKALPIFE